ncbi:hypothetical protein RRF57_008672 [Xylaria bambusicola]|uniref:Uncharacterized protein n=1 Tax=Xylaria bambusicola TaxID=326684 RepID=A0AAN7UTT6_9PEZI
MTNVDVPVTALLDSTTGNAVDTGNADDAEEEGKLNEDNTAVDTEEDTASGVAVEATAVAVVDVSGRLGQAIATSTASKARIALAVFILKRQETEYTLKKD